MSLCNSPVRNTRCNSNGTSNRDRDALSQSGTSASSGSSDTRLDSSVDDLQIVDEFRSLSAFSYRLQKCNSLRAYEITRRHAQSVIGAPLPAAATP